MSTFGKAISVSLFGESHGKAIGITIHGLPAGITLDLENINNELTKRRPKSNLSTPRQEADNYDIISGFYNSKTTGTPLTIVITNSDTRPKDYHPSVLRPSHADYTAHIKHKGHQDYRGSGHFSGRITAPLVVLGAICSQILKQKNIVVGSHIKSIKNAQDTSFENVNITKNMLETLLLSDFPLLDVSNQKVFEDIIISAKENKDSVGGIIETCVLGLDPGYGDPFFESIESVLSHLLYSIPSVKGVSFGKGFDITSLYGSEANDSFVIENDRISTNSNNSGGIQGGISNGMPITFNVGIKPTASIGKRQTTVNLDSMKQVELSLEGRHDPCIVHRVVHVINAITAYGILEIIARKEGLQWIQ